MKAPAAARALPKLAERARGEEWSYERFAAARFPARKTLEEFDFTFQRSWPPGSEARGRCRSRLASD
jgi:DNA replication protein DnaC